MGRERAILIAGPTASGKSALALGLAERLGGLVINADSMAVYRDLSVLTGRPSADDRARAPHALYGLMDASDPYSVGIWLEQVAERLKYARGAGLVPIVVGGTGLYFKALTQGLSEIPVVPDAVRTRLREDARTMTAVDLHAHLARRDPTMAARLRPTDAQRVLRALEVLDATGQSLATFQTIRRPAILAAGDSVGVVIAPDRQALRAAIDRRFDIMMQAGALDEARALGSRGLDPALPAMRALGVPPLLEHLSGGLSLDDAVARAKAETRAYAKRQVTFARHQLPDFVWIALDDAAHAIVATWRSDPQ